MTDRDTQATAPAPATTSTTESSTRPKRKQKQRRKPRRREGAGDDSDGGASDAGDDSAPRERKSKPTPLFPDITSTTPTAWADMDATETVTFDEFSRSESRAESTRGRGASSSARGGKPRVNKPPAPLNNNTPTTREPTDANDEDRIRSAEERARVKRERQKAKRKEAKDKQRAAAASKEPATAGEGAVDAVSATASAAPDDVSLAASTSALTLDDSAGPNRPRTLAQRMEDPKVTPRVGNFWMHDQRHDANSESFAAPTFDSWRGRGGARGGMPRGSFRGGVPRGRGRGRGGFGSFGPFNHGPGVARMQTPPAPPSSNGSARGGRRMTEMDKLELELAQKDKNRAGNASSSDRWGHEGFEEQASTEDAFRNNRAARGRGRAPRGVPHVAVKAAAPRTFAPANLPTPEASPDRAKATEVIKPTEGTMTQSAADDLLADSGNVTVRLPGDSQVDVVARPPSVAAASAAAPSVTSEVAPQSTGSPFPPAFTPSNPSPGPYVASDSGSISSGYIPPASVPPYMGGEFYPQQTTFRPPTGPGFVPRNFSPQSFTPEPAMQPHGHQPRSSFSGHAAPFYPSSTRPRPGSPLNPYAGQMFYMPQQKAAMRADGASPSSDATESTLGLHVEGYPMPAYYYNPYSGMPEQGGMYYPPQGYWPQGYEMPAYGYEGEYPGY